MISELEKKGMLQKKELEYDCQDSGIEGSLIFHYQNKDLKLISHSFDQGHEYRLTNFYVSNDSLFFYFTKSYYDNDRSVYDEVTGKLIDEEEDWTAIEQRVYFDKKEAFKCLLKQYENEDVTDEISKKYPDLSIYFKNKETSCDSTQIKEILSAYQQLLKLRNSTSDSICRYYKGRF